MSTTSPSELAPVGAFRRAPDPLHAFAPAADPSGRRLPANPEPSLRRAAAWARRGIPHAPVLLMGSEGRLRFRPDHGDLRARLPGGEDVRVGLCSRNHRVVITRTEGSFRFTASADLPPHLVEDAT
jgi:hypothetical protein